VPNKEMAISTQSFPAIAVTNIIKAFKDVKAVNGISMDVAEGEFLALLGPNGAGKTTLVEMIEGLQVPDSGEIQIMGRSWKSHRTELQRLLGISLQETRFIDKLTVLETLKLFASFFNITPARITEILDLVDLGSKAQSYVVNLSGGQRQRLALGLALLHNPCILLLDEPTTGLDPTARREIWDILMRLKQEKKTSMILTTHYMEEAEQLCDRILILHQGSILAQGTLKELIQKNGQSEIIELGFNVPFDHEKLKGHFGITNMALAPDGSSLQLGVKSIVESMPGLLEYFAANQITLTHLGSRQLTLDDLFIAMTGRRLREDLN
jgi:ABC-2 type transport system ATP-binding protein